MNKVLAVALTVGLMVVAAWAYAAEVKGAVNLVAGQIAIISPATGPSVSVTFPVPAAGGADMMAGLAVAQEWEITYTTAGTVNTVTAATKAAVKK